MAEKIFLHRMLDRLCNSLLNGPGLSCKPHRSRQRIDATNLSFLQDQTAAQILPLLLGKQRKVKIFAKAPFPKQAQPLNPGHLLQDEAVQNPEILVFQKQQNLLSKLHGIVEDTRTYIQDTGVHPLFLGFPLLSIPALAQSSSKSRRILAPVTLIPIRLEINQGAKPSLELFCHGEGTDLVIPNPALLTFFEQQFHAKPVDIFSDEEGQDPWREIREWIQYVCSVLEIELPSFMHQLPSQEALEDPSFVSAGFPLQAIPEMDILGPNVQLLPSGILGLFPMSHQNLIRDLEAMIQEENPSGPIKTFITAAEHPDKVDTLSSQPTIQNEEKNHPFDQEFLITAADPFQAQAVSTLAQQESLVVHGPPGTGKSQTIINMIGDSLAHGRRVLLVCEKRAALDVVAHRLERLGLGDVYALVHDPQRDRRDLYKKLRDQLDTLSEAQINLAVDAKLTKINEDLKKIHTQLVTYTNALQSKNLLEQNSLQNLISEWMRVRQNLPSPKQPLLIPPFSVSLFQSHEENLQEIFSRAETSHYHRNPWRESTDLSLTEWMSHHASLIKQSLSKLIDLAQTADQHDGRSFSPFSVSQEADFQSQGVARNQLADKLESFATVIPENIREYWLAQSEEKLKESQKYIESHTVLVNQTKSNPLDAELLSRFPSQLIHLEKIPKFIQALASYLRICTRWYKSFCFRTNARARQVLQCLDLSLTKDHAERAHQFFLALQARLLLKHAQDQMLDLSNDHTLPSDLELLTTHRIHLDFVELLHHLSNPALASVRIVVRDWLLHPNPDLLLQLRQSLLRSQAMQALQQALVNAGLFSSSFLAQINKQLAHGDIVQPTLNLLLHHLPEVENVLRVKMGLSNLPLPLHTAVEMVLTLGMSPETGLSTLHYAVLDQAIRSHIKNQPFLYQWDEPKLTKNLERLSALMEEKQSWVCAMIMNRWKGLQKQRLVSPTGNRLSSLATELRRRLLLSGDRALRLRQVVHSGLQIPEGDPLFDLCPVWMASPETVAQIFPRLPLFDIVIFDEASQCRLEEALPVLLRAHKVVIAGDMKQMPPTRFFESAIVTTQEEEPENDQDLFEQQQSEIEDLLGAALNIGMPQCYLDVHYRSRNPALIHFSNHYFYESLLQPLPIHPAKKESLAAIELTSVNGIYEKQCNQTEAEHVVKIVKELLLEKSPPSIGIACFNRLQRNLILAELESAVVQDSAFAQRLELARNRQGAGTFEGLFVKNLENIQGDERDHLIISTTYGPDPKGRFYRRFGPLGQAGGGRRLNVLITRAKQKIHLITSIPQIFYQNIPAIPPQEQPSGVYLLFAYLKFAEELQKANTALQKEQMQTSQNETFAFSSGTSFALAKNFADYLLLTQKQSSQVLGENTGFCIDVALPPTESRSEWIGILCDHNRFTKINDPILWEAFRRTILTNQGWKLKQLWSPHFFRDPEQWVDSVLNPSREIDPPFSNS